MNIKVIINWVKLVILAVILLIIYHKSVYSTGTTELGVRTIKWSLFGQSGVETNKVYQPGGTYFFLKTKDGNDIRIDITFKYRIDPKRVTYIREYVAGNMLELKEKVVRAVVRSKTRDYLGAYSTEEFYHADNRNKAAEAAKEGLQKILDEYGIIVEDLNLMDYRFDPAYQKVITDKKIADAKTTSLISQEAATLEMNKKLLNDAKAEVNQKIAEADGQYNSAVLNADAYYMQQTNIAAAIIAEGEADAASISKMREAMNNEGGQIQVKMAIAEALRNKRIVMVPMGGSGAFNLQTLDINAILREAGLVKPQK